MSLLGAIGIGSSILGDVLGFGSQNATNKANIQIARENREWQSAENLRTYNQNLEQWNRENEYNSPEAQMARLSGAGLNPNLVYGNGATTTSASSPQLQPAKADTPHLSAYTNFQVGDMILNQAMKEQQIKLLKEQARGAGADADQKEFNLGQSWQLSDAVVNKAFQDLQKATYDTNNAFQQGINLKQAFDMNEFYQKLDQQKFNLSRDLNDDQRAKLTQETKNLLQTFDWQKYKQDVMKETGINIDNDPYYLKIIGQLITSLSKKFGIQLLNPFNSK